ncbi:hypothetical protein [Bradyrhizobium sp. LMG 9283]|uniref:hypothetical protein n=1 Tax=Bradyrhizobium sp. LMG 9283 TaxID=592064 RepID=UPI003890016F
MFQTLERLDYLLTRGVRHAAFIANLDPAGRTDRLPGIEATSECEKPRNTARATDCGSISIALIWINRTSFI